MGYFPGDAILESRHSFSLRNESLDRLRQIVNLSNASARSEKIRFSNNFPGKVSRP